MRINSIYKFQNLKQPTSIRQTNSIEKNQVSFSSTTSEFSDDEKQKSISLFLNVLSTLDKNYQNRLKELAIQKNVKPKALLLHPEICLKNPIRVIPQEVRPVLNDLKIQNENHYNLVMKVISKIMLYTKTQTGVSEDYISNFIKKLITCSPVLLKNVIDNDIPIKIYDDVVLYLGSQQAGFAQGKKVIEGKYDKNGLHIVEMDKSYKTLQFSERALGNPITVWGVVQNTYESLPHELAHAFDYYNGTKLGLTAQDFITVDLEKDENNDRFSPLASFSKEFEKAFYEDFVLMGERDEQKGKPFGTTFKELLNKPNFAYYFGIDKSNSEKNEEENKTDELPRIDDINARKELFAQMVSYVTAGYVTNIEFNKRIEELFPNCLKFTKELLERAESI